MLRLTDAGRAAMMDGTNRQMRAIQIRSLQIGDGLGPGGAADDSRVALRSERGSDAVVGTTMVSGRLAVRATFTPTTVYAVTEVGLIARIGNSGADFLFAYLVVPDTADAVATTVSGFTLIIAGVIDASNSVAEMNVTIDASITFGGPATWVDLNDTPGMISPDRYARGNNTGTAIVWGEAPPRVSTEAALPAPAPAVASTYAVVDYDGTGRPAIAQLSGGVWVFSPTRQWAAALVSTRVSKAGDTMSGDLRTVTPAANDDSRKAANTEWVMARLAEGGGTIIANDTDLIEATASDIALSASLAGFRWLRVLCSRVEVGGGRAIVDPGVMPIAGLSAPDAAATLIGVNRRRQ